MVETTESRLGTSRHGGRPRLPRFDGWHGELGVTNPGSFAPSRGKLHQVAPKKHGGGLAYKFPNMTNTTDLLGIIPKFQPRRVIQSYSRLFKVKIFVPAPIDISRAAAKSIRGSRNHRSGVGTARPHSLRQRISRRSDERSPAQSRIRPRRPHAHFPACHGGHSSTTVIHKSQTKGLQ